MSTIFSGVCLDGPWEGQFLAHYSKRLPFMEAQFYRGRYECSEMGSYVYDDEIGSWDWEPSK